MVEEVRLEVYGEVNAEEIMVDNPMMIELAAVINEMC